MQTYFLTHISIGKKRNLKKFENVIFARHKGINNLQTPKKSHNFDLTKQ